MKRIYTVQHTQSEHHTNGMVGSWTDWNLTDLGKQQADRIAEKLKQEFDGKEIVIYTSDLKRAKQTADSIASRFQVEPIVKKELRERRQRRRRRKGSARSASRFSEYRRHRCDGSRPAAGRRT